MANPHSAQASREDLIARAILAAHLPARASGMRYETVPAATIVAPWRSRSRCSAPRGSNGTDERVAFDTRKAMALLAHLALADRPRSRDALCALLWPAHDPGQRSGCSAPHALDPAHGSRRAMDRHLRRQHRPEAGARPRARRRALPGAGGGWRLAREPERGGGAVLRRLPGGFLATRQPGLRRLADGRGGCARARAGLGAAAPGGAAGRAWRIRAGPPPRAPLARGRSIARARPPRADPAVCLERRPRCRARAVPQLRSDAEPGARGGAARRDGVPVRPGERRKPCSSTEGGCPARRPRHAPRSPPKRRPSCRLSDGPRRWPRSRTPMPAPGRMVAWP